MCGRGAIVQLLERGFDVGLERCGCERGCGRGFGVWGWGSAWVCGCGLYTLKI